MKNKIHLIGNAHIDPVWFWRFGDGLSEIKATFRSALDRIQEFDGFIFTSACASYYRWIEEVDPKMFEEIRRAVKAGKWAIAGGMWVQPDCNIPSAESFARHLLYSQRYFYEKFGRYAKTGYNVDSFGHNASLPKLLKDAEIDHYVYMRPGAGAEKQYPFDKNAFHWKSPDGKEVLAFRIHDFYTAAFTDDTPLRTYDTTVGEYGYPFMIFYGVGNHGGGPTIRTLQEITAYQPKAKNRFLFSDPDGYFADLKQDHGDTLPIYEGDLQHHASGCYSANAKIKQLNRTAENRLNEAERFSVMAEQTVGHKNAPERFAAAWENVMFNQFHDILCGCSIKEAYDDAYAFYGESIAQASKATALALQKISWRINTAKPGALRTKDKWTLSWEHEDHGAPFAVFNPLPYPIRLPITVQFFDCTSVTDESGRDLPFQKIRADYSDGYFTKYRTMFLAELPAFGYRTFWKYSRRPCEVLVEKQLEVGEHFLENDRIRAEFDPQSGCMVHLYDKASGADRIGGPSAQALVIDDSDNDTWAHGNFKFDRILGKFDDAKFEILEDGICMVSLRVTTYYKNSHLEQIFSLIPGEAAVRVKARLVLNEGLVMIKLAFDSGLQDARAIYEIPGGILYKQADGLEEPMQRFFCAEDSERGLAIINDSKYSACVEKGEMRFIAARSCYYADHCRDRDGRIEYQDIGPNEFAYQIMPYTGRCGDRLVTAAAEAQNACFPVIPETYHEGNLPQAASFMHIESGTVTLQAIKRAEDGNGWIVRLRETSGNSSSAVVHVIGETINSKFAPLEIKNFRVEQNQVTECNLLENPKQQEE